MDSEDKVTLELSNDDNIFSSTDRDDIRPFTSTDDFFSTTDSDNVLAVNADWARVHQIASHILGYFIIDGQMNKSSATKAALKRSSVLPLHLIRAIAENN